MTGVFVRNPAVLLILVAVGTHPALGQEVLHTEYGTHPDAQFGESVASAGDVDGNGVADFIVGGAGNGLNEQVQVFSTAGFGRLLSLTDPRDGIGFGHAVSGVGDVNSDGLADFVVGASEYHHPAGPGYFHGRVTLHSGFDGSVLRAFVGPIQDDRLGESVSGAGDVDQDGVPDIVLGAPGRGVSGYRFGAAFIQSGSTGAIIYSYDGRFPDDRFGFSVSESGDVNADGYADVVISSPYAWVDPLRPGKVSVYSGFDGTELHLFQGAQHDSRYGHQVADGGDVNQDGFDDILVGSPAEDRSPNGDNEGAVRVFSGVNGELLHLFRGTERGGLFGWSVASAGDVDRDGAQDILAGAPEEKGTSSGRGTAWVFLGGSGEPRARVNQVHGLLTGWSVDGLGDLNQDGLDDFIVSSVGWRDPVTSEFLGSVVVHASCGTVEEYGSGCPGAGGYTPLLKASGCPRQGGSLTLSVSGAAGGVRTGLLLVGADSVALDLGGGCTLLVHPFTTILPLLISGVGDGRGQTEINGGIPSTWPLGPTTLQVVVPDAQGFKGYTMTNAVQVDLP